jgi:hypothetical protein
LRDEVISEFKSSADRERQHAKVVRPAIQTIELAFEEVLRDLANDDVNECQPEINSLKASVTVPFNTGYRLSFPVADPYR